MVSNPGRKKLFSVRMRAEKKGRHISGAEGIFTLDRIPEVLEDYSGKALSHTNGTPSRMSFVVEPLPRRPTLVPSLPVFTLETANTPDAREVAGEILSGIGVSTRAIEAAFKVFAKGGMRGAAILDPLTGNRLEPDKKRGVRASMLGITGAAEKKLISQIEARGLQGTRLFEALILASKVAAAPGILAELCTSDNGNYMTGYLSTPLHGYLRLPNLKKKTDRGGRVFFVSRAERIESLIEYLEETPVLVGKISPVGGIISPHETDLRDRGKPGGKKGVRKKVRAGRSSS